MKDPYFFISKIYDFFIEPFVNKARLKTLEIIKSSFNKNAKIIDIGCGTCEQARLISNEGFNVIGIEPSKSMFLESSKKTNKNLKLINTSAEKLPFKKNYFDAVIIQLVLHEMSEKTRNKTIKEIKRILKKDGKIIILDFNKLRFSFYKYLILLGEKLAGKEHYKNSMKFLQQGGIIKFLEKNNFKIIQKFNFLQKNLSLISAENSRIR